MTLAGGVFQASILLNHLRVRYFGYEASATSSSAGDYGV
jgi:hypothetical protein